MSSHHAKFHDFEASFGFTVILKPGFSMFTIESAPPWIVFFLVGPKWQIQIFHCHVAFLIKDYNPFGVLAENKFVGAGGR